MHTAKEIAEAVVEKTDYVLAEGKPEYQWLWKMVCGKEYRLLISHEHETGARYNRATVSFSFPVGPDNRFVETDLRSFSVDRTRELAKIAQCILDFIPKYEEAVEYSYKKIEEVVAERQAHDKAIKTIAEILNDKYISQRPYPAFDEPRGYVNDVYVRTRVISPTNVYLQINMHPEKLVEWLEILKKVKVKE